MPTVLPQFLSPAEVAELRALAESTTEGWTPGRQHTGYDILPLRAVMPIDSRAEHGRTHRRINAVLAQAASGGELTVGGEPIALAVGDAVLFSPDRDVHEVTKVSGPRLLFSVGAWV